jgi:uncharacterized damage-inducible protein DinB
MIRKTLATQLALNHRILTRTLDGIDHEASLQTPPAGGNCINWIVGHVVATRDSMLAVVGEEKQWEKPRRQLYGRGSASMTAANALPLSELQSAFETAQQRLLAALAALPEDRLAASAAFTFPGNTEETNASLLASLASHEAYHIGQTAILRRMLGRPGAIG